MKFSFLFLVAIAVGCTKPNPATCCLDQADCSANGFNEIRECAPGLACVNHECEVPKCSTTGCTADAPVCNIVTDACDGCVDSAACSRFSATPTCDAATGECVECVTAAECTMATKAICDMNICRGCRRDEDCLSGACGDDGACVPEASIVYLAVGATNSGTCPRSAPCGSVKYAISQTSETRDHVVMSSGGYVEANIYVDATKTTASSLSFHGGGAALIYPSTGDASMFVTAMPVTIRDLELSIPNGQAGSAIQLGGTALLERVRIHDAINGISVGGPVTLRDVSLDDVNLGITLQSAGTLTITNAVIRRGYTAITATNGGSLQIENLLVWGTQALALDLSGATGTIAFSTIADSGTDAGTGPRAVNCSNNVVMRSTIVWAPGNANRAPMDGCVLANVIAGPTAVAGALNVNPQFVDAAAHDYHIKAISPARDAVDTGPATDFEGDPRPRGAKFDIGADEAP